MLLRFQGDGVIITAPSATLASLVALMSRFTVRPVVDLTGIQGQYEFKLNFAQEANPGLTTGTEAPAARDEPTPSVFDAVKQYGLRLEARNAPIEMLTVVHIKKTPTEN